MRIRKLHIVWFWGLLLLMSACGEDDYYYPSVKLEFVTVKAGTDGSIQTLITDNGEAFLSRQNIYDHHKKRSYR